MINNCGVHEWEFVPGLPDSGAQNLFVNHMSNALVNAGFRVTTTNRGGYAHPDTGDRREGIVYRGSFERILLLEDGLPEFVRKEVMLPQIAKLVSFLHGFIELEKTPIELIVSHYWDSAKLGCELNQLLPERVKHVWVPHSLGLVKRKNTDSSEWAKLNLEGRIQVERSIIPELNGIAATSSMLRTALEEDYGYSRPLFFPPCVVADRFEKREVGTDDLVWNFLSERCALSPAEIQESKIIIEISRTTQTKRKHIVLSAFAQLLESNPNTILIMSIDDSSARLADELFSQIKTLGIKDRTVVVGLVPELLPKLLSLSDVFVTASSMEGFGMSVQQAAAAELAVVSSDRVPYAVEYLLGKGAKTVGFPELDNPLLIGHGAVVVPNEDVLGFAAALTLLLNDDETRTQMGKTAHQITVPYFTWSSMLRNFLNEAGVRIPNSNA